MSFRSYFDFGFKKIKLFSKRLKLSPEGYWEEAV